MEDDKIQKNNLNFELMKKRTQIPRLPQFSILILLFVLFFFFFLIYCYILCPFQI